MILTFARQGGTNIYICKLPWHGSMIYIVIWSPPATDETGTMGLKIESRRGRFRVLAFKSRNS
jgi:hypothetical protein